jgi:Flp pilus assembly protein TadD
MTTTSTKNPPTPTPKVSASGFQPVPTRIPSAPAGTLVADTVIPEVIQCLGELERQLAVVHRACSEAYVSQGKHAEALVHQEMAARLAPDNAEYRNQLGCLRYLTGDDGAVDDFRFVLERLPGNAEAWYNLGMVRFGQGDFLDAERSFAKAVEQDPREAETWNNLGVCRYHLGRLQDARTCFERALQIDPESEDARANLADCSR